jgi:putative permease
MQIIRRWVTRYFNDPQVVGLAIVLLLVFGILIFFGQMLTPVLASLVLAYLLEGLVRILERWGVPRLAAVLLVFSLFFAVLVLVLFALLPILTRQLAQLVEQIPAMLAAGQELLMRLPQEYPAWFSEAEIRDLIRAIRGELMDFGQRLLASLSFQSVVVLLTLLVYLVLVPFLVFFFLKDKERLLAWFSAYLPRERRLATNVWREVDHQIGNYVRGKFLEILIVWFVTYVTFSVMKLQFAMLLAVMVGLSVIVPYVGAAVVTVPVAAVAYAQFGFGNEFLYIMIAYIIIQALDGNVLVPVLFSEAVNLHPVAIIVAILVFGGIWGFWGVFFAIPLATLTQAILKAWASLPEEMEVHRPPPQRQPGDAAADG